LECIDVSLKVLFVFIVSKIQFTAINALKNSFVNHNSLYAVETSEGYLSTYINEYKKMK
jgi:hypothetical protein